MSEQKKIDTISVDMGDGNHIGHIGNQYDITINPGPLASVVGLDVVAGDGPGPALEITSNGTAEAPSIGALIDVTAKPGQNTTGVRVSLTGNGSGIVVRQSGPGAGLKVILR